MSERSRGYSAPDTDIYVGNEPFHLRTKSPKIYDDYAVRSSTDISIGNHINTLLANREFRQAARRALPDRPLNLIEIKVRGSDNQVLVRDPEVAYSKFVGIDFESTSNVREIADKTQVAYERAISSRSSSTGSSPFGSRSPLTERYIVHDNGLPSLHFQERLRTLELENIELRSRVENLELHRQLAETRQLLEQTKAQLIGSDEVNQLLSQTITSLQEDLRQAEEEQGRTHQTLQQSVALNLVLLTALSQLRGTNTELTRQVVELQERNLFLEPKTQIQGAILKKAQELLGAENPAELTGKIKKLQEELEEKKEINLQLRNHLSQAQQTQQRTESAKQALEEELGQLKLLNQEQEETLDQVRSALDLEGSSSASLPELATSLTQNNQELKEKVAAFEDAKRKEKEVLGQLSATLGKSIESITDLPAVVEQALTEAEQKVGLSDRRVEVLEQSVSELEKQKRQTAETHQKELEAVSQRALQAEEELIGERSLVQDEQLTSQGLRGELSRLTQSQAEEKKRLEHKSQVLSEELEKEKAANLQLQQNVDTLTLAAQQNANEAERLGKLLEEVQAIISSPSESTGEDLSSPAHANLPAAVQKTMEGLRDAQRKLEQSSKASDKELREQLREKEDEVVELQESLGQRANLSEKEASRLTGLFDQMNDVMARRSLVLKDQLKPSVESLPRRLESFFDRMKEQEVELEAAQKKIERIESELTVKQLALQEHELEGTQKDSFVEEAKKEIRRLKSNLEEQNVEFTAALKKQKEELLQARRDLKTQKERSGTLDSLLTNVNQEISSLEEKNKKLLDRVARAKEKTTEVERELSETLEANAEQDTIILQSNKEIDVLKQRLRQIQSTLDKITGDRNYQGSLAEMYLSKHEEAQREHRRLSQELQKLEEQASQDRVMIKKIREENRRNLALLSTVFGVNGADLNTVDDFEFAARKFEERQVTDLRKKDQVEEQLNQATQVALILRDKNEHLLERLEEQQRLFLERKR